VTDEGIVAVVKRDCPTCALVAPVLEDLVVRGVVSTIYREDDDDGLEASWRLAIETVPTLLRGDKRIVGWSRAQWEEFTGVSGLGDGLPEHRPGCGSRTLEPGLTDELAVRFSGSKLRSRRVELAELEDDAEALQVRRPGHDALHRLAPCVLLLLGQQAAHPRYID